LVLTLALIVASQPALAPSLLYERADVVAGQYWRLWTGHLVHFGASHLGWNLAVFTVAGAWCERLAPGRTRLLLALAPGVIGLALFALDPSLATYGGLSGVATAVLTLLAFTQLARLSVASSASAGADPETAATSSDRWFWRAVLALIFLKTAAEFAAEQPFFARYAPGGIRAVPVAHLIGILVATIIHRRRGRR
jgi:rhomboid family GlyGly-CTERM serine protease